ncbi:hypothetical protein [Yinghuangia soli]|uniref:Uncharacterized protein n=1 Tax=Yinghuangia soli TaxID=2908204 RepID=A0AA41U0X9_9ACTN|nr:hypothetical protein [Yinghuangia soli]MCF2530248.1 hypothetical protein [Yinghuangia soli]
MKRLIARGLLAAVLAVGGAAAAPGTAGAGVSFPPTGAVLQAGSAAPAAAFGACDAGDNLGEVATNFISRCRKASIRQVFPGEHYGDKLGEIRNCGAKSCKTAWKLLNDNRFKK